MKVGETKIMNDSLENLVAEMGTQNDKRSHTKFTDSRVLTDEELIAMYRTNWISGKVVDIVPDDATREWRSFVESPSREKIEKEEKRIGVRQAFNEAAKWSRLFGAGVILISVNDGKDPSEPLEIESLKKNSLRHIKVVDKSRISHTGVIDNNPMSPNFGRPDTYTVHGSHIRIHSSRILRFDGIKIPHESYVRNSYWHDSILQRVYDEIVNMGITTHGSASMVFESNVDVMKIQDLMQYLSDDKGTEIVRKRFALAKLLKSFNNMLLLDSTEEYVTHNNSFAGLHELLSKFMTIVAAATDIPATRFLGQAASGFNATGEGDLKNYYDMIAAKQPSMFDENLEYLDMIMARHLGVSEENMEYEWNSLFQMSETEQAEIELKRAQRDDIYLGTVLTEEIIAKQLNEDGTYSGIDDEYIAELEAIHEQGESAEIEAAEHEAQEGQEGQPDNESEGSGSSVSEGSAESGEEAEAGSGNSNSSTTEED